MNRLKHDTIPAKVGLACTTVLALTGCLNRQQVELQADNDFPTLARVEYVIQCMNRAGGQTYDTLYPCVCSIDQIASRLAYDEYAAAVTFTNLRATPGEKGAIFRDPPQARALRKKLKEAESEAHKACFVKKAIVPD